VEKYCSAGQATDDSVANAHRKLGNYGYKHTLRICNTYRFYTAKMVARTRLNVKVIPTLPVLFTNCVKAGQCLRMHYVE